MKLEKIYKVTAKLTCLTGLHIGGGDSEMHIGGVDNQIIKNPVDDLPYIPGSSLKGKIRSLMEWRTGHVQQGPIGLGDLKDAGDEVDIVKDILRLFGVSGDAKASEEKMKEIGPARLSFWDCKLNDGWIERTKEKLPSLIEIKTENSIDRISGTAQNPRQTERIPAGAEFDFTLTVKKLDSDKEDKLINDVLTGLKLLELDALGGSGSRGYGKIKFTDIHVDKINYDNKFKELNPFALPEDEK